MLARHFWRLWGGYFLGALGYHLNTGTLWFHRLLALLSAIGLLAGLWRTRNLTLAAATVALVLISVLNTVYVAEARDNERMIPLLVAAGVAGWFIALRPRPGARRDTTSPNASSIRCSQPVPFRRPDGCAQEVACVPACVHTPSESPWSRHPTARRAARHRISRCSYSVPGRPV